MGYWRLAGLSLGNYSHVGRVFRQSLNGHLESPLGYPQDDFYTNGQFYRRMTTRDKLFKHVHDKGGVPTNKVSVVGVGQVGMATVFSLLTQQVTTHVALVDSDREKLKGEALDLLHGSSFLKFAHIEASTDYKVTKDSKVCVVAAGVRQRQGETRLDLVQRNTDVLKAIIPQLVKHSPDTIILVASNPVDILTYVSWKISGLPIHRVIGSGCNLDSARFRFFLSSKIGVAATSCHGYIIGEHGDSSVPVWSGVNIAGVMLKDLNKSIGKTEDPENWKEIHKNVVNCAYEVIKLKGYTSWAIGLSLTEIVRAILNDAITISPVTACVKGQHGVKDDIFLSLPCVLGREGIYAIIQQPLSEEERKLFLKSADVMAQIQSTINL